MTGFVQPQLLTPARQLPTGPSWRYELKYDGYRVQIHVTANEIQIFTRSGLDWTHRFPQLAREIAAAVRVPCILDGEIYATDCAGRPDFTLLCSRLGGAGSVRFAAFDLLEFGGGSSMNRPLSVRRDRLATILSSSQAVHLVEQMTDPDPLLAFARQHSWEGVVAKTDDSQYHPGLRSPTWRKLKLKQRQEFVVAGWRPCPATGSVKSLVLATIEGGRLILRGSVGTGFTLDQRRKLPTLFVPARTRSNRSACRGIIALEPELVAEIEYLELSGHGIVRQPTFVGLRTDKSAADVSLEMPAT